MTRRKFGREFKIEAVRLGSGPINLLEAAVAA